MSLVKVVVALAVIGLVLFDAGAVMVNQVQADDLGQRALRAAVVSYDNGRGSPTAVEAAVHGVELDPRASVDAVVVTVEGVAVTVSQRAQVLVLDQIPPLEDLATATVTKQAARQG